MNAVALRLNSNNSSQRAKGDWLRAATQRRVGHKRKAEKQNRNSEATVTSDSALAVTHTFLPSHHTHPRWRVIHAAACDFRGPSPSLLFIDAPSSSEVRFEAAHGLHPALTGLGSACPDVLLRRNHKEMGTIFSLWHPQIIPNVF